MAEKRDRNGRKDVRVDRVDTVLPPPVSEGFSLRTQIRLFLVALFIVAGFLYGLYQPFLRYYLAQNSMDRAKAWIERARVVKADTTSAYPIYDHIEDEISALMPFHALVNEYLIAYGDVFYGDGENMAAKRGRLDNAVRVIRAAQTEIAPRYHKTFEFAQNALVASRLGDTFPEIASDLARRKTQLDEFFAYGSGNGSFDVPPTRDQYSLYLIRATESLMLLRRVRDLFDERAAYDQALRELTVARGYGRTWSPARKMLADFYYERGFYPFGLEEDLIVMRIDGNGSDGAASFARIRRSVDEKRPEAPYRLGIAHLLRGEMGEAETAFRLFVGTDPSSPFVVKAWELIAACERKDKATLDAFVEDEIWI